MGQRARQRLINNKYFTERERFVYVRCRINVFTCFRWAFRYEIMIILRRIMCVLLLSPRQRFTPKCFTNIGDSALAYTRHTFIHPKHF